MGDDDSSTHSIEKIDMALIPSCSSESDDCRINCTDQESLCKIVDITLTNISELADSCNLGEFRSEFITKFSDSFQNALQENIVINGLPWMMNQSKLTSPQKEDHKQMVDDAILAKLGKTVSDVAYKRKFCPEQCCRILNIKMKHELQNLKKAKFASDSALPKDFSVTSNRKNKIKPFVDFCKEFRSIEENIQHIERERRTLEMKMSFASSLQKPHKMKPNESVAEENYESVSIAGQNDNKKTDI